MKNIPEGGRKVDESYLVKTYCVSRHQARRLIRKYGCGKAEMDFLLGVRGRTRRHRSQDIRRTPSDVSFG